MSHDIFSTLVNNTTHNQAVVPIDDGASSGYSSDISSDIIAKGIPPIHPTSYSLTTTRTIIFDDPSLKDKPPTILLPQLHPFPLDQAHLPPPKKEAAPQHIEQFKINHICSCLLLCRIQTRQDLIEKMDQVLERICQNPKVFKAKYSTKQCLEIFQKALEAYSRENSLKITLTEDDLELFETSLTSGTPSQSPPSTGVVDDLSRVTQNYDTLEKSYRKLKGKSEELEKLLEDREFVVCPHIILGAGDSGTTIWLEKYKRHHGKTNPKIAKGELPQVLMLADSFGCWKHDYTLAQPHNLLERATTRANPSDYVSKEYHQSNPYANARHIYQANVVNLAKTDAPLLIGTRVLRIEQKINHADAWKSQDHDYRMIIFTSSGEKAIYTNEIDICTGLGPAKNAIAGEVMSHDEFDRLSRFDPEKKFTPIVDGNQFILTDTEEQSSKARIIVVYGGGGTAAACYRKGFFGHDIRTEPRDFVDPDKKHKVLWYASNGFNAAGGGKLATKALTSTKKRDELFIAKLKEVRADPTSGKLILRFMQPLAQNQTEAEASFFEIECDQLVYALGQEDSDLRAISQEFYAELVLNIDEAGVPLHVATTDEKVHYYGAAAMAIKPREYPAATWKWLDHENIGRDVGPGSMPPSRAQIKKYTSRMGIPLESVNVNIDNHHLIQQFLIECGVDAKKIPAFIEDVLEARKHSTAGFSRSVLESLLHKHSMDDKVKIIGHGHLLKNITSQSDKDANT